MTISVVATVKAPLAKVWQAYTTAADIVQWNAASAEWHTTRATVDLRPGGQFCSRMEAKDGSFGFDFEGVYTDVVTHQYLQYKFGERQAKVTFHEQADGVEVRVVFDPEETHSIEQQQEGWQAILNNFKRYVESE
jgi:uncharacterized protein YndB with AHSA1/START domain